MFKREKQHRRKEKEEAEKAKGSGGKVKVATTAERTREKKPDEERPVIRDREDRGLRMRDDSEMTKTQRLEASIHADTSQECTTTLLNESSAL